MPPTVHGYRVDALLGQGGTSDVWLGWSRGLVPRPVAIKIPRGGAAGESADRWRAHAEVLQCCHHPGLLSIDEVVETADGPVVVLPYADGGSLADLLEDIATLTPGEVAALIAEVVDAVLALHAAGFVHGDIKAANVLLTASGRALVADALAVPLRPTRRAGCVGEAEVGDADDPRRWATPAYLAPEVAAGAAPGPAADVFAVAVLAYEALTGCRPHSGSTPEVLAAAAEGAHRSLTGWPHVPAPMADAVEAGLAPEPADRPGMSELADALVAAVAPDEVRRPVPVRSVAPVRVDRSRTVAIGGLPRPEPAHPTCGPGRRLVATAALGLALLILVAGSTTWFSPHRRAPSVAIRTVPSAGGDPSGCGGSEAGSRPLGIDPVPVNATGSGCAGTAQWRNGVLSVTGSHGEQPRRYAVGRVQDQVLIGDWDGDGHLGVAVYEPDRGRVLYADRLPDGGRAGAVTRAERVVAADLDGRARVVSDGDNGRFEVRVDGTDRGGGDRRRRPHR